MSFSVQLELQRKCTRNLTKSVCFGDEHSSDFLFVVFLTFKEEEEVPVTSLHYYDNKLAVDHLMSKPHGLFYLIDEATRGRQSQDFITGKDSQFTVQSSIRSDCESFRVQ